MLWRGGPGTGLCSCASLAARKQRIHVSLCSLCTLLSLLLICVETAHSSTASAYFLSCDTFLVRFCKMKCVVFSSPVRSLILFIIHLFPGEYGLSLNTGTSMHESIGDFCNCQGSFQYLSAKCHQKCASHTNSTACGGRVPHPQIPQVLTGEAGRGLPTAHADWLLSDYEIPWNTQGFA